jgi:hypothetical protein
MVPFGVFRLKFPLGIAYSGRGPIAAIGAASRSRVCWPDVIAAAPFGGRAGSSPAPGASLGSVKSCGFRNFWCIIFAEQTKCTR